MGYDLVEVHIGFDGIDTPVGGCTTHFTYRFVKELILTYGQYVRFKDYPNLIRLNPSIPHKTRGNGSTALRLLIPRDATNEVFEQAINSITRYLRYYCRYEHNSWGLALLIGKPPKVLRDLYLKALTDYVHKDYVLRVISTIGDSLLVPKNYRPGLVGALAAIGADLSSDCTYELLVYRLRRDEPLRSIDPHSVRIADEYLSEWVFSNYDYSIDKPLVTPHGPDPVLLGIRGEDPKYLIKFLSMVRIYEPIEGFMIFRTNQGTDAHYVVRPISDVRPYQTCCTYGYVSNVKVLRGGDVLIRIVSNDHYLWAVIFRESGLTNIARSLISGDYVFICGSSKYWLGLGTVVHVEKFSIIKARPIVRKLNPKCPRCGKRLKSAGRGKGWKCPRCGFKVLRASYEVITIDRSYLEGHYVPTESKLKHLTKPLRRYGREKICYEVEPLGIWYA